MKRWIRIWAFLMVLVSLVPVLPVSGSEQLVSDSDQVTEKIIYGFSGEGRELVAYRYGSGPNVLILGFALHGFEDNFDRDGQCLVECGRSVMAHLDGNLMVDGYGWTVYVLPCMNPDGLYSGYTCNGPGRCTTTYLSESGALITDGGIDLNRCFPTDFTPKYNSRNFTSNRPMAAREAQALDAFIREVKGQKLNVLIDVHGWLQQTITRTGWLRQAFYQQFKSNSQDGSNGGGGYLIRHASALGYESMLLELPRDIHSMDDFRKSDITEKMILSVENVLLKGTPACGGNHQFQEEYTAPTCLKQGSKGSICTKCGLKKAEILPATGHTMDTNHTVSRAPTATQPGYIQYLCTVCNAEADVKWLEPIFRDTKSNSFYAEALDYCYTNDIVKGTSANRFSPDDKCDRGNIVTLLWRSRGCPESAAVCAFRDVSSGAYYADAVRWAQEHGITSGTTANTFSPSRVCTREEIVTFLWRAAGSPEPENKTTPFTDLDENAYYYDAVLWAYEKGITSGYSRTKFAPKLVCTRAEAVTFLYRALVQGA